MRDNERDRPPTATWLCVYSMSISTFLLRTRYAYHCVKQRLFNRLKPILSAATSRPINSHFCTSSEVETLSPAVQNRVLSLLAQFREGPSFKRNQQKSIDGVREWIERGGGRPQPSTYNFLLHLCVLLGSSEDIQLAVGVAEKYGLELKEREMNIILTGLSLSAGLEHVKKTLQDMRRSGTKVRVNTQTNLLQRAVNERDVPLALEVIDSMNEDGSFPSSLNVISEALRVWGGAQNCDGVEVVRGVMGLHNNHSLSSLRHEVDESTATAFTEWIKREHNLNKTRVNEKGVCQSCGEQLESNELTQEEYDVLLHHFKEELSHELGRGRNAQLERRMTRELIGLVERERYGAVLDGLNIAYTLRNSKYDHLLAESKKLVEKTGQEVLVFGRPHITRLLPRQDASVDAVRCDYRAHGVHLFLLNHSSRDDRYLIYAALACNSLLVSNDEFGDKVHGENWDLQCLFRKWQRSRQVRFAIRGTRINLQYPTVCERVVQWSEGSWHLPLNTHSQTNWLCARVIR